MQVVKDYIDQNKQRFLDELIEVLQIPSVSANPDHKTDMVRTAEFVAQAFLKAGVDHAEVIATPGHPVVFAEKFMDASFPTILVYGHYDVQPPDPLDLWNSPPFEPVIKKTDVHPDGAIFARGSCDDKGQVWM